MIEVVTEHVPRKNSPMSALLLYRLDGAYSRIGDDETAFSGGRSPRYGAFIEGFAPDTDLLAADRGWVRNLWEALRPYAIGSGDGYVNGTVEYQDDRVAEATARPSTNGWPGSKPTTTRTTCSTSTPTSHRPNAGRTWPGTTDERRRVPHYVRAAPSGLPVYRYAHPALWLLADVRLGCARLQLHHSQGQQGRVERDRGPRAGCRRAGRCP